MATLVNNLETFQKHVTVNANFTWELILPYIIKAERKHIKPAIGTGMYEDYTEQFDNPSEDSDSNPAPDPIDPKILAVLELLQEASSNLALLAYTFVGIISVSDNGFSISYSAQNTPAEWWQIRDLRRSVLDTGNEAIDEALAIMEANPDLFEDWVEGEGYTVFTQFYTRKTQDFQRYFNIQNSRLTFLQLRPYLFQTEKKYFDALLGPETTIQIKLATTPEEKEALQIAQSAQVALTIAEITNEGLFLFTPQGLFRASMEVPGEKRTSLSQPETENLSRKKQVAGQEYLKELVAHLSKYPLIFPDFAVKEANVLPCITHNTKSILSL